MSDKIREAQRVAMSFAEQSTDSRTAIAHIRGLCKLLDSALAQQPAAAVPKSWISVSERLPDHGDAVQVWCSGAECAGVAWMRQGAWYMPEPQAIGYDTITHWQPLARNPVDAPAAPVAQEPPPVSGVVLRDGQPTLLMEKFVKPTDQRLYTAPPAAEQPDTVAVPRAVLADMAQDAEDSGAQLLANRLRSLLAGGAE